MVKKRLEYQFPSSFENEIEAPLRRQFRSEKKITPLMWILIGVALVSLLHFFVELHIGVKEAQAEITNPYAKLCTQYLNDAKLSGTAAEETLKEICP